MEIFFSDIPDEGLHLEGELPGTIFDLAEDDPIRPAGPVRYRFDAYAFEEVVAFSGSLRGPFRLQCGTCLEYFDHEADFPAWSAEIDREPGMESFDLEALVREEFLLLLPSYPRCDDGDDGRACPKAELLEDFLEAGEEVPEEPSRPDVWSALDGWKQ